MASISKREYVSWKVSCSEDRSLNATFGSEALAQSRLQELREQGCRGLSIKRQVSVGWQVRIRRQGAPDLTKTFPLHQLAKDWAAEKEGEIVKRQFIDYREADRHSLGDLLLKYDGLCLAHKPKDDPDRVRIAKLSKLPIASIKMSLLLSSDITDFRDKRLNEVKGSTVTKELELLSRVITVARREWKIYLAYNAASGKLVKRPPPQPGDERERRLRQQHEVRSGQPAQESPAEPPKVKPKRRVRTGVAYEVDPDIARILAMPQDEQQALFRACRYPHWYTERKRDVTVATLKARAKRAARAPIKARLRPSHIIWALASFAIETAMRRGEMLKLRWSHANLTKGYLDLPSTITKNRKPRLVPLSRRARRILAVLPRDGDYVFATSINTVKLGFNRALARAGCVDLRLHDLRHEATSRLFEQTDLRDSEIGFVTGHTHPRMLQRYYNKRPDEFVNRFHKSFKKKSQEGTGKGREVEAPSRAD